MLKPYASIQNRILIDYRMMKSNLVKNLGIDLEEEKKKAYRVHPNHQLNVKNISSKRKKTKLNSLTIGNLARIGKIVHYNF